MIYAPKYIMFKKIKKEPKKRKVNIENQLCMLCIYEKIMTTPQNHNFLLNVRLG